MNTLWILFIYLLFIDIILRGYSQKYLKIIKIDSLLPLVTNHKFSNSIKYIYKDNSYHHLSKKIY